MLADAAVLPNSEPVAILAESEDAVQDTWAHYGLPDDAPEVRTARDAVLFVGLGESSTCRLEYDGYLVRGKRREIEIQLGEAWPRECVDDFLPRTFVVAIPKADLPPGRLHVVTEVGDELRVKRRG